MKNFFWSVFEKSGNIDAFLAYKDLTRQTEMTNDIDKLNSSENKSGQNAI